MSIILNALRKSEQERLSNPVETLEDKIQVKHEVVRTKKLGWILPLIIINCLLLSFFLWQFMKQEDDTTNLEPVNIVEKTKESLVQQAVEKNPAPTIQTKPQSTIAQKIQKNKQKKKQPIKQQARLTTLPSVQTTKMDLPSAQAFNLNQAEPKAPPPRKDPLDSFYKNTPPFLAEMSYDFRRSVPRMNINVYVYSEQASDRFIMIDMQKFQEGAEIMENMVLKEIRSNSFVIEYRNEVFQIQR